MFSSERIDTHTHTLAEEMGNIQSEIKHKILMQKEEKSGCMVYEIAYSSFYHWPDWDNYSQTGKKVFTVSKN